MYTSGFRPHLSPVFKIESRQFWRQEAAMKSDLDNKTLIATGAQAPYSKAVPGPLNSACAPSQESSRAIHVDGPSEKPHLTNFTIKSGHQGPPRPR